ncbi:hypothetical protein DSM100685_0366 [Bifidobacterium avesanii]|nr:hypothetical protein DSM100685_0366 [Bifidobacterium avesanii]
MQESNAHHPSVDHESARHFDDVYDNYAYTEYGIEI